VKARSLKLDVARGTQHDFKKPAGVLMPQVDPNRCEGKGPCITVCPVDVLVMGKIPAHKRKELTLLGSVKAFVHGNKHALVQAPESCRACGLCVQVCPENAIKLVAR
jgi:4Fe-4S ferredoxin